MRDEDWIKEAMSDDSMVAELLMRMNPSETPASLPLMRLTAVFSVEWGVRFPRSRQVVKKEGESMRASPTTPLSWIGGTSLSGGGGGCGGGASNGYEESSRPVKRSNGERSKVTSINGTSFKRSRKKKTFAELKEEQNSLLKERTHLNKEIVTFRMSLKEQRAINKSLKRRKLFLQLESVRKSGTASDALEEAISSQPHHTGAANADHTSTVLPMSVTYDVPIAVSSPLSPSPGSCEVRMKNVKTQESCFVLPDLNLPVEEDAGFKTLYGMS